MPGGTRETSGLLDRVKFACTLAEAARPVALGPFRKQGLDIANKAEAGFDPVTEADLAIEQLWRDMIVQAYPEDGIIGEEFDALPSQSGLTWILDPIDGTRAYMAGAPSWGMLIACTLGSKPVIGVLDQPFTGERFNGALINNEPWALWERGQERHILRTRDRSLAEATLLTTDPALFVPEEFAAFQRVRQRVRLTRYGLDCYAYGLIALGTADLVIEAGLSAYDIAALIPIIEAAGGVVSDWRGDPCYEGGQVLAAGSESLHQEALALLSGAV